MFVLSAGLEDNMTDSQYGIDEIKYNIDTVIQSSMFETDEENWKIILEVQSRLYEEFGINE
jgi:hypothetical protein